MPERSWMLSDIFLSCLARTHCRQVPLAGLITCGVQSRGNCSRFSSTATLLDAILDVDVGRRLRMTRQRGDDSSATIVIRCDCPVYVRIWVVYVGI
jgi:hypothetical protein